MYKLLSGVAGLRREGEFRLEDGRRKAAEISKSMLAMAGGLGTVHIERREGMKRGTDGSGLMSYPIPESDRDVGSDRGRFVALAPDPWPRSNLRSGLPSRLRRIVQHRLTAGEHNTYSASILFVGLTP